MNYICHFNTPLGGMTGASDGQALTGLWFDGQTYFGAGLDPAHEEASLPVFDLTRRWLELYFGGGIPEFTPPIKMKTTPFRREVWEILLTIPYGQTVTYGEIAAMLAERRQIPRMSAQAVGGAVGHNPISLIIPCHRVVGAHNSLTGYAGGIGRKQMLLEMEKR